MEQKDDWVKDWVSSTNKVILETSAELEKFASSWGSSGSLEARESCKWLCASVQNKIFSAVGELTRVLDELHPPQTIPWLPADESLFKNMTFLQGRSPWSFVLGYAHPSFNPPPLPWVNPLHSYFSNPKPGSFVCCVLRGEMFRGLVIECLSSTRFKVLNIDKNEVSIMPKSAIHHLPKELCEIHALSIHCTMLENDEQLLKSFWSEDLEVIFTKAFRCTALDVKILKSYSGSPPKYLVEVIARRDNCPDLNLSEWLHDYLIPDIKVHCPLIVTKEELVYFLKDESVDPFLLHGDKNSSKMQDLSLAKIDLIGCASTVNSAEELSTIPLPTPKNAHEDANHIPTSNSVEEDCNHPVSENGSLLLPPRKLSPSKPYDNRYLSCYFDIRERGYPVKDVRHQSTYKLPVEVGDGYYTEVSFKNDQKENPPSTIFAWDVVNKFSYPRVGDIVNLSISTVTYDLSFYAILDEKYCDYNDNGALETYTTLQNRLNNPGGASRRDPLKKLPSIGQLVIYKDEHSQWQRGIVFEIHDGVYSIINPDKGFVHYTDSQLDLRPAEPVDIILPYQAVRTQLFRTRIADGQDINQAIEYFCSLTMAKKMHAIVRNAIIEKSTLEVELISADAVNINQALISTGLCVEADVE